MSRDEQDWLPRSAATHEAVALALRGAVGDWSAAWFAGASAETGPLGLWTGRSATQAERWLAGGEVAVRSPARERLAASALGAGPGEGFVTGRDRDVADRLASRLLADLAHRIAGAFGAAPTPWLEQAPAFGESEAVVAALGLGPSTGLVEVVVAWPAVLRFAKAGFARTRRQGAPLADVRKALGPARVELQADLGRARLTLSELATLSPGDVLVLDTKISEGALVCLAASSAPLAHARLTNLNGQVGLTFEKAASP